jgi:group II intron reverse transcriptase/maturase
MKKNMSLNEQQVGNLGVMNSNQSSLLMQQVLERNNLHCALKQVQRNKGAPGVDGMTVDDLPEYLKHNWLRIREDLLNGTYKPKPVRRVEIPKPNGAKRKLGIPTVLDRFIQQAIAQVLSPIWEEKFHPNSYGFRPHKSAHTAIRYVQYYARQGKTTVVDLYLQSFFDEVNHDRLMSKLKSNGTNSDVMRLINSYLKTPVLSEHGRIKTTKGVPQGGPLSPLLSNIVLNEMDWELQSRGLSFVRYADDCQILVGSQRAGERILANLTRFLEQKLKLKVNQEKSAVDHIWNRSFLGFTLLRKDLRIKVSAKAQNSLKTKVRMITRRTRGHAFLSVVSELKKSLLGWKAYFDISEVLSPLKDLDKWIRRKLRCYLLKQWGRSGYRKLRQLGIDRYLAWNTAKSAHGPWRLSHSPALYKALPNRYFRGLGLPELAARK